MLDHPLLLCGLVSGLFQTRWMLLHLWDSQNFRWMCSEAFFTLISCLCWSYAAWCLALGLLTPPDPSQLMEQLCIESWCLEAAVPLLCSASPVLVFVAFLPAITCLPTFNPPKQFAKELLLDANLPQACRTLCHGFKFNKKPSSLGLKMTSSSSQSNSCLASFWLPVAHTCMLQLCVLLKHTVSTAE